MKFMHARYNNPVHYESMRMLDPLWVNIEESSVADDQKETYEILEDDIIALCMKTEFCKQTGLSYLDVMQLEFPAYQKLRNSMFDSLREKSRKQEAIRRESEQHSTKYHARLQSS